MLRFNAQDDGEPCLAESDKKTIRANLVPLMCRAPPEVQRQVHFRAHQKQIIETEPRFENRTLVDGAIFLCIIYDCYLIKAFGGGFYYLQTAQVRTGNMVSFSGLDIFKQCVELFFFPERVNYLPGNRWSPIQWRPGGESSL